MPIEALEGMLYPNLGDYYMKFGEYKDKFTSIHSEGVTLRNDIFSALIKSDSELASYHIELKIESIERLIQKIKKLALDLKSLPYEINDELSELPLLIGDGGNACSHSNESRTSMCRKSDVKNEYCCGLRKVRTVKAICYTLVILGSLISLAGDTTSGQLSETSEISAIKYFKQYIALVVLPILHGVLFCEEKEARLVQMIKSISAEVHQDYLVNVNALEYLIYKKDPIRRTTTVVKDMSVGGSMPNIMLLPATQVAPVNKFLQRGKRAAQVNNEGKEDKEPVKKDDIQKALNRV